MTVAAVVGRHKAALSGELEWIRDVCMVRDTQAGMERIHNQPQRF